MPLRDRIPYVLAMSVGGALLLLNAWQAWTERAWPELVGSLVVGQALLVLAAAMGLTQPDMTVVPEWARRFEVVSSGAAALRCNQCDGVVLPGLVSVLLPRLLTYAHLHSQTACERRRTSEPGGSTARLGPPARTRTRRRRG